jgi:hypothetical protein
MAEHDSKLESLEYMKAVQKSAVFSPISTALTQQTLGWMAEHQGLFRTKLALRKLYSF